MVILHHLHKQCACAFAHCAHFIGGCQSYKICKHMIRNMYWFTCTNYSITGFQSKSCTCKTELPTRYGIIGMHTYTDRVVFVNILGRMHALGPGYPRSSFQGGLYVVAQFVLSCGFSDFADALYICYHLVSWHVLLCACSGLSLT